MINLTSNNSLNISPKILYINKKIIFLLAKIGDFIRLPINTIILKKLTQDYMVSNNKIKKVLQINNLPMRTHKGIIKTIVDLASPEDLITFDEKLFISINTCGNVPYMFKLCVLTIHSHDR